MTVRALKLTLLPVKLPLTRPSFPFQRSWTPFKWRPLRNCLEGSILRLLLSMKLATWYYNTFFISINVLLFASWSFSIFILISLFYLIISIILLVKSSSLLLPFSDLILGLICGGGIGKYSIIKFSGLNF
jgi:hypothetical protein